MDTKIPDLELAQVANVCFNILEPRFKTALKAKAANMDPGVRSTLNDRANGLIGHHINQELEKPEWFQFKNLLKYTRFSNKGGFFGRPWPQLSELIQNETTF